MVTHSHPYPARLSIDYPEKLDRVSTLFRLIWAIPIFVILALLTATASDTVTVITDSGEVMSRVTTTGLGIAGGLFVATMLMIVFRQRYPRWWFDFALALNRFSNRVGAYLGLLTDRYPSTEAEQSVHLDFDYPNVEQDLSRWMPLVKWLLAIPHYIVLAVLGVGAFLAILVAWVRHPHHGPLPPSTLRLRGRGGEMGPESTGLLHPADHRPVSPVQPPLNQARNETT
jgi:mannose/fructose/N-acetylgalactosamine-specific phosphotransferase system component IIC